MAKKKSSIGCLFWIALILLVIVIFLLNKDGVAKVAKSVGLCKIFPGLPFCDEENPANDVEVTNLPTETEPGSEETDPANTIPISDVTVSFDPPEEEISEPIETPEPEEEPKPEKKTLKRHSYIYFVKINPNSESISLEKIQRTVHYVDTPLTETLNALLTGLSTNEINSGFQSMIPVNTKILEISIRNGTAYLNFNTAFTSSDIGKEGVEYRLKQIIYTCTEFPTVKNVQFLINGKVQKYISADGLRIDSPLGRGDL